MFSFLFVPFATPLDSRGAMSNATSVKPLENSWRTYVFTGNTFYFRVEFRRKQPRDRVSRIGKSRRKPRDFPRSRPPGGIFLAMTESFLRATFTRGLPALAAVLPASNYILLCLSTTHLSAHAAATSSLSSPASSPASPAVDFRCFTGEHDWTRAKSNDRSLNRTAN